MHFVSDCIAADDKQMDLGHRKNTRKLLEHSMFHIPIQLPWASVLSKPCWTVKASNLLIRFEGEGLLLSIYHFPRQDFPRIYKRENALRCQYIIFRVPWIFAACVWNLVLFWGSGVVGGWVWGRMRREKKGTREERWWQLPASPIKLLPGMLIVPFQILNLPLSWASKSPSHLLVALSSCQERGGGVPQKWLRGLWWWGLPFLHHNALWAHGAHTAPSGLAATTRGPLQPALWGRMASLGSCVCSQTGDAAEAFIQVTLWEAKKVIHMPYDSLVRRSRERPSRALEHFLRSQMPQTAGWGCFRSLEKGSEPCW